MEQILKMLTSNPMEFMQQSPLMDLQVPVQSVFPTVLALPPDMAKDSLARYRQNIEDQKPAPAKKEDTKGALGPQVAPMETAVETARTAKKSSDFQKPEGQEVVKADMETRTYSLVYYNPESKRAELVEESVSISYEDETEQAMEEALGQRSAYSAFSLIATPLIREQVDEQMLKEIMDRIRIEAPSPFGGGAAVKVEYTSLSPKLLEEYGEKIIALEVAEKRKANVEERIAAQIVVVDAVVKALEQPHANIHKVVEALPPLSRERIVALYSMKKRVQKKTVLELLLKDKQFLSALRVRISAMRVGDILEVVRKIKKKED